MLVVCADTVVPIENMDFLKNRLFFPCVHKIKYFPWQSQIQMEDCIFENVVGIGLVY